MPLSSQFRGALLSATTLLACCNGAPERRTPTGGLYHESITQSAVVKQNSEEASQWALADERFGKMFDYIKTHSLDTLSVGRHEIGGDDIFLLIVSGDMIGESDAPLEAHDRYFDVQIPLLQPESFGVSPRAKCVAPRGEMNTEADIIFFDDTPQRYVNVGQGEMIVFTPETAHAPMIGSGSQLKAVFKIKCD
jgi:YhcH/YjgK/YiaL family protein